MPEETTLDAFAEATSADADQSAVETTMVWRPAGETCHSCGETVSRLWRTDGCLVCHSCMVWADG